MFRIGNRCIKVVSKQDKNIIRRYQSSITFSSNQSIISKNNRNGRRDNEDSSVSNKKDVSKDPVISQEVEVGHGGEMREKKSDAYNRALDFSWLPKVPQTSSINHRDMTTNALYSGYRPIFVDSKKGTLMSGSSSTAQDVNSSFYEFAMKLNNLNEPSPWMMSATGLESYNEWDYIPSKILKGLKPFQLSEDVNEHTGTSKRTKGDKLSGKKSTETVAHSLKDEDHLHNSRLEGLVKETNRLVNRSKGRKKPVVRLLQLIKSFQKDKK